VCARAAEACDALADALVLAACAAACRRCAEACGNIGDEDWPAEVA
jgi:hypothetical protein